MTFGSVEELLASAREVLHRVAPEEARRRTKQGALIVDIRPAWQRQAEGEIPDAVLVERNHLEWRLDPRSDARLPEAVEGQEWIVVCSEGYASSLAAASLVSLGLPATDIIGGVGAWREAGLPVRSASEPGLSDPALTMDQ